jgi:hypothetical protein
MIKRDCYEISIWSGGDEGRLWEWRPNTRWRVFEHYNYRHTFEEAKISTRDIAVLRQHFGVSDDIPESELLQCSPDELIRVSQQAEGVE